jgi:hypothetical protein
MKKLAFLAVPMLVLAAGAASAQRQFTPGQFFTGLTESGAEALAAQVNEMLPGVIAEVSFDVGFDTWTVQIPLESGGSSGE